DRDRGHGGEDPGLPAPPRRDGAGGPRHRGEGDGDLLSRGRAGAPLGAMPELPEVERARRRTERALRGHRIAGVKTAPDPIVYDGAPPLQSEDALRGRRVLAVRRKGKHLWMELDRRPWPLFHFGMTGGFEFYRREEDRPRFWKVELRMDD